MNFNQFNLDPRLLVGINRLGYTEATPIQVAALPAALAGDDLIGTAQTGTGKTAVFVLPILHKLLSGPRNRTRALIVTPTRELAEQIHEAVKDLGPAPSCAAPPSTEASARPPRTSTLRDGVEILVACPGPPAGPHPAGPCTPGWRGNPRPGRGRPHARHGLPAGCETHPAACAAKRQTMLFSATFPQEIEKLAAQILHDPERIASGHGGAGVHRLAHLVPGGPGSQDRAPAPASRADRHQLGAHLHPHQAPR